MDKPSTLSTHGLHGSAPMTSIFLENAVSIVPDPLCLPGAAAQGWGWGLKVT